VKKYFKRAQPRYFSASGNSGLGKQTGILDFLWAFCFDGSMKSLSILPALFLCACGAPSNQTPGHPVAGSPPQEAQDCDPACFHIDDQCLRQTASPIVFMECGSTCCPSAKAYTDPDKDWHIDNMDQCPYDPEDFDSFEDLDGCPDPDNDADGMEDDRDACPLIPEDFDGQEDGDGCPEGIETDLDGDGILDSADQCPQDPEDLDGFQDDDGCPDPDNDGDGILDIDDLCPNDPEDMDGVEDANGCPDFY
jgi:hypothetical protein